MSLIMAGTNIGRISSKARERFPEILKTSKLKTSFKLKGIEEVAPEQSLIKIYG
jgi:hypothetical protein